MNIRIEEITEEGITLKFSKDRNWLAELFSRERDVDFSFASPIIISLSFKRTGLKILIHEKIETSLQMKCTRCAEDFVYPLNETVMYALTPSDIMTKQHSETELTSKDLELSFYNGEEIDIDQIVKEQIFLSVPSYPRCSKTCKGLCAGCGVNLNVDSCQCSRRIGNSPFSVMEK
jgi:uncharacterized protein